MKTLKEHFVHHKEMYLWLILFIGVAVLSRVVPHIPNFTPIVGIALFLSYIWKTHISMLFVILSLFISNLILGYEVDMVQISVYIGLLFPSIVGIYLKKTNSLLSKYISLIVLSFSSSTFFFIITNFAVWLWSGMYTHDVNGFILCYEMAIPFYRNTLLGDFFSSMMVFGVHDIILYYQQKTDTSYKTREKSV